ncbi:MAG: SIR2 family protein [Planctomycetales bacterium]|nr:SIR2 family protein [Planctomycetales bacterium]
MDYPNWVTDEARAEAESSMSVLHRAYKRGRLGIFIGAGASVPAGAPSTSSLIRAALEEHLFPGSLPAVDSEGWRRLVSTPFELLMGVLQKHLGDEAELEAWLREKIYEGVLNADAAYGELAGLVNDGTQRQRRIFTTNFDNLIEVAIGERAKVITSANAEHLNSIEGNSGAVSVVHFHGFINQNVDEHSRTFIATEAKMLQTLDENQMLQWRLVESLVGSTAFVFVGFSLADANIKAIYSRFRSILASRERGVPVYFVTGGRSAEQYRLDAQTAPTRNAKAIPVTCQAFFRELRRQSEEDTATEFRQNVSRRLRDSADEYEVLEAVLADEFGFDASAARDFLAQAPNRNGRRS